MANMYHQKGAGRPILRRVLREHELAARANARGALSDAALEDVENRARAALMTSARPVSTNYWRHKLRSSRGPRDYAAAREIRASAAASASAAPASTP